jgi:hypothetical protein
MVFMEKKKLEGNIEAAGDCTKKDASGGKPLGLNRKPVSFRAYKVYQIDIHCLLTGQVSLSKDE